jgi:hypothetical protein
MKKPKNEVVELCKYDVNKNCYGGGKEGRIKISKDKKDHQQKYDPPLPTSVVNEPENEVVEPIYGKNKKKTNEDVYNANERVNNGKLYHYERKHQKGSDPIYDPPLPNSILEVPSQKGKHPTQKPTALMEWVLKYYTRENDLVLDPTMGSGSTGVACQNMNRRFIGIEMDEKIFEDAKKRLIKN